MVVLNQNQMNEVILSLPTIGASQSYAMVFNNEMTDGTVTVYPPVVYSNERSTKFLLNLNLVWLNPPGSWQIEIWSSNQSYGVPDGELLRIELMTLIAACPQINIVTYPSGNGQAIVYQDVICPPGCLSWNTTQIWNLTEETWNCE